jgi:ATP-dependent DNA helicase RecQ
VYQLISQGVLLQVGDEYPILKLTPVAWEVMRGQRSVRLVQPVRRKEDERPERSKAESVSWEGVNSELFEVLRGLRKQLADERKVPPYVIFSDATLRELARVRPKSQEGMRLIYGIGATKLADFGSRFFRLLDGHCHANGLSRDNASRPEPMPDLPRLGSRPNPQRELAFNLFRKGVGIEEVAQQTGRERSTLFGYLEEYVREECPPTVAAWVRDELYHQIAAAVRQVGNDRLKPIYLALGERVSYDDIRIVRAHLMARNAAQHT